MYYNRLHGPASCRAAIAKNVLEDTIMKNAKWIVAMLMAVIMLLAVGCASEPADTAATPAPTEAPAEEAPAAEAPAEEVSVTADPVAEV